MPESQNSYSATEAQLIELLNGICSAEVSLALMAF